MPCIIIDPVPETCGDENVDLNLLTVFDAIMRERNVLRAGQAISLSPSAVSHALARLRALLNDELFVRTAAGMVPTARANEMAPLVRTLSYRRSEPSDLQGSNPRRRPDSSASRRRITSPLSSFPISCVG